MKISCAHISDFDSKVYSACKKIPKGKVATYKILAEVIGHPKAYRAVGSALRKNPFAPEVPCHRVVATDRTLGGFYGSKDVEGSELKKKYSMLVKEGIHMEQDSSKKGAIKVDSQFIVELSTLLQHEL